MQEETLWNQCINNNKLLCTCIHFEIYGLKLEELMLTTYAKLDQLFNLVQELLNFVINKRYIKQKYQNKSFKMIFHYRVAISIRTI